MADLDMLAARYEARRGSDALLARLRTFGPRRPVLDKPVPGGPVPGWPVPSEPVPSEPVSSESVSAAEASALEMRDAAAREEAFREARNRHYPACLDAARDQAEYWRARNPHCGARQCWRALGGHAPQRAQWGAGIAYMALRLASAMAFAEIGEAEGRDESGARRE